MMHPRAMTGLIALIAVTAAPATGASDEMLPDPAFAQSSMAGEWWATDNVKLEYRRGRLCGWVEGGTAQPWDAIVGLNGLALQEDEHYRFSITVSGNPGGPLRALVQEAAEPWTAEAQIQRRLDDSQQILTEDFTATETRPNVQLAFQIGGAAGPWRFCLHAASLQSGHQPEPASPDAETSAIRVNQHAYFTRGPKRANLINSESEWLDWSLVSASGETVAKGRSRPQGFNMSSEREVHTIDFTGYRTPGEGYRLVVGEDQSPPFAISDTAYAELRTDALAYFYKVRSGIEIREDLAGPGYGRPAGHLGKTPNRGDTSVGCVDTRTAREVYGEAWSCGYRLDVRGGWYDAGDFGKYVVNGGIATAQLLGVYERTLHHHRGSSPALEDGFAAIPESGNGVPDILDEARWELDFLMSMTVPDGEPFAGMAHHKVHGNRWTVGPILPHLDPELRVLHRPSTAATLNLAAAAAQGARLFARYDKAYADRLLAAAIRAYRAAEANPAVFAPYTDGSFGGGDYQDDDVSDEFYWAASELYITTGDAAWLERAKASPHWLGPVFEPGGFNWRSVAAWARLQLASVPSQLPKRDLKAVQVTVRDAADRYLSDQRNEAFGFMYSPANFGWGSNHSLIQNMIVVATAFDITGDRRYLQAVQESMDYLLGRNVLGISYITGYGTTYAQRQYSNIFAASTDPSYPPMPKGALAGGPNSGLADDYAISKLEGCAPQACYVDDSRSYSTNEIAINWNAPLVWIASFLADAP